MANVLNNDIYDLVSSVQDIEERYIPEEAPETLALGIYGYLADIHATILQNSAIATGELGNELFPGRAKFERNVISHAIIQNIENLNAVPATISAIFGIFEEDLDKYMVLDKFIIDKEIPFGIEEFEYHLEYDVIVQRTILPNNKCGYSALYDMTRTNPLSKITNPYLQAPFMQKYNGRNMVFFYVELMQVRHSRFEKTLITNNLVENKTLIFSFTEQLADFSVRITEGDETIYLTPVFEGMGLEDNLKYFCYYQYIDSTHIRVRFDSLSYVPKINAKIYVDIKTTSGAEGNFEYTKDIFPIITSENYNYKRLSTVLQFASQSQGGLDRKSVDELRRMLPKEALSRGSITCWQDLENYFNMLNTDENRLIIQKRVDNQFERSYFAYMLLKDTYNNVIPTNTFDIDVKTEDFDTTDNRKYVLKPGCWIIYDDFENNKARIVKPTDDNIADLEKLQEDDKVNFIYTCPFMLVVTGDPLYVSYYLTLVNTMAQLDFTYVNTNSTVQFICTNVYWYRQYLIDSDTYFMEFAITPNIYNATQLIVLDENNKIVKNNIKVFVVFFNEGKENAPYAYCEATFNGFYEDSTSEYKFIAQLTTEDILADDNKIYIHGLKRANSTQEPEYMLLTPHVGVKIYVCAQLDDTYGVFGRHDLDSIVPEGLDEYTVCNMYTISGGLNLYENYSEIIQSQVKDIKIEGEYTDYIGYSIKRVPCVRRSYVTIEENMLNFIDNINYKKAYIDDALYVLEDNFLIDFKFFNTYGPSRTYTLDRWGYEKQLVDRVNLTLNFEVRLLQTSDKNTKEYILRDIKEIIEDLNDISSLHIPNLITTITNTYRESIEYIEFLGFNDYGPGEQHIYRKDYNLVTGTQDVNMVPEFLTVHTNLDMSPDITITLA